MDKISSDVLKRINNLLGVEGKTYRRFVNGEWVDTDCYLWQQPRSIESHEPQLELPLDLKKVMKRISKIAGSEVSNSKEFDLDAYTSRIRELFEQESDAVKAMMESIRPELEALVAYPSTKQKEWRSRLDSVENILEGSSYIVYGDIIVAPADDQFDTLRIEETSGNNYEIGTEEIISALKSIDDDYGVKILSAGFDHVSFEMERPPIGNEAIMLGKSLNQLCPDLFEPSIEFPDGIVELWWD